MPESVKPPLSIQLERTQVPVEMPMSYLHFNKKPGRPLLLLFQGYEDTAAGVFRRTLSEAGQFPDFEILVPNGLFPVPVRITEGWKQGFAWYFSDISRKQVLMPPQVAAGAVSHLLSQLNLQDRPKVLIGFSQGGFFLPFLFPHLQNIKKIFGIGTGFRVEDYPEVLPAPLDAIHGENDKIVSFERTRENFDRLKTKNPKGEFYSFPDLGHSMNDQSRALLKERIFQLGL